MFCCTPVCQPAEHTNAEEAQVAFNVDWINVSRGVNKFQVPTQKTPQKDGVNGRQ